MEISPLELYRQAVNKQRIMIVGDNRKTTGRIIAHVLKHHQRKFDYVADQQDHVTISEAPVFIYESPGTEAQGFHHHILVLTPNAPSASTLCDLTPKSGIIVYPEWDTITKGVAAKERADVLTIAYKPYKHEKKGAELALVSSTNERFPIKFSDAATLEAAAAAKEVLKKIGISSSQFYKAIQSFE